MFHINISSFSKSVITQQLSYWSYYHLIHKQILFYIKVHKEFSSVLFKYGYFTYISTSMLGTHGLINKGWVSKNLVQLEYLLKKALRQLYAVLEFHISKLKTNLLSLDC